MSKASQLCQRAGIAYDLLGGFNGQDDLADYCVYHPYLRSVQTETQGAGDIKVALNKLETYIGDAMQKTGVPGLAVAVVYRGQVVFLKGYGLRKLGETARVDPDTVFEIAFGVKTDCIHHRGFPAGAGKVSWDDRIESLDPDFALSDQTATQQATHTTCSRIEAAYRLAPVTSWKTWATVDRRFCDASVRSPGGPISRKPTITATSA